MLIVLAMVIVIKAKMLSLDGDPHTYKTEPVSSKNMSVLFNDSLEHSTLKQK